MHGQKRCEFWDLVQMLGDRIDNVERSRLALDALEASDAAMSLRGEQADHEDDERYARMDDLAQLKVERSEAEDRLQRDLDLVETFARTLAR